LGGGGAIAQTNSTVHNFTMSSDATKIIYFSPTFGGFSFAFSWAPDRRGEDTHSGFTAAAGGFGGGGTTGNNNAGQVSDEFAGAVNFEHDFNGIDLVAGIGGALGQWERPAAGQNDDTWLIRGNALVSFSGVTVGASGVYQSNYQASNSTEPDLWVAGIGATYNWDAWTVGLAWSHGAYEVVDSGSDTDTLDIIQMTGRYDLGPGISLDGVVGLNKYDSNFSNATGFSSSNDTWEAGVGFWIGF
ncbi:MAG: porin, partial [Burkholderiales bacterium]